VNRRWLAGAAAVVALAVAAGLGVRAWSWNDELALASPPVVHGAPPIVDPATPRLSRRVVLVIIDGLGADEAALPYLDELRARGAATTARVPYPTISRPNYVTILTGVPPADSGVRTNRVRAPVAVDTIMDRVRADGSRVASAADYGMLASLFLRNATTIAGVGWDDHAGQRVTPPAPITWPFDDVRRADSLAELGPRIAELVRGDAAFVPVLVLDVDRAGHADGVGAAYRDAARDVDRMLRTAFAGIDLARDTVIVTADHGHVAPGGHGGTEEEVSRVPLVLAGAGIVPGARARDARLIDVAPTVAALLGIAAPREAEGRALTELLALDARAIARRTANDRDRAAAVLALADAARADAPAPSPLAVAALIAVLALAVAGRRWIPRVAPVGAAGAAIMLGAVIAMTRGTISPSYVPSLPRVELLGGTAAIGALVVQLVASWRAIRRTADRAAAAIGVALGGLGPVLAAVCIVRTVYPRPFVTVPGPHAMVLIPALDLAAAVCALGTAAVLAAVTARDRSA
jgi:type I phosphodiesterase/nucleotide pyrophosphatase